jgi:hypothetical protein
MGEQDQFQQLSNPSAAEEDNNQMVKRMDTTGEKHMRGGK